MSRRILFFILAITVLTLWQPDYLHNDNSVSRALAVMSLVEEGNLYFDQYQELTGDKSFINGHVYSDKAPFPVFIVYPVVKMIQIFGLYPSELNSRLNLVLVVGGFLVSAIPLILIMVFLFTQVEKLNSSYKNYWLVTLPFLSSFIWVYNASFYSHVLAGFLLCGVFITLQKKNSITAGVLSGFAFLTEYPVIIIPLMWLLQELIKERKIKNTLSFLFGLLPLVLFLFFYNYLQSGLWFQLNYDYVSDDYAPMKQNYGFDFPSFKAIWGMIFSSYRGLLFYSPLFIPVAILALYRFKKNKESFIRFITHTWFIPFLIYLILISSYFMWWGGWSFGPRHLIPIVIFIFFYEIQKKYLRQFFVPLLFIGILGLFFLLIVKSTVMYGFPSGLNPFTEVLLPAFENDNTHTMNILTIWFNLKPSSSAIIWFAIYLMGGLIIRIRRQ